MASTARDVLAEFLNRPREVHAAVYGLAAGYAFGTDDSVARLGILGILTLGDHSVDVAGGRPAREVRRERQYTVGFSLLGVALARVEQAILED